MLVYYIARQWLAANVGIQCGYNVGVVLASANGRRGDIPMYIKSVTEACAPQRRGRAAPAHGRHERSPLPRLPTQERQRGRSRGRARARLLGAAAAMRGAC